MDMRLQKLSGLVMITGSVVFLATGAAPTSSPFVEPSAQRRLELVLAMGEGWQRSQVLFGIGAMVTVIGVGLAAYQFRARSFAKLVQASAALLLLGALLWIWHLYLRALNPATWTRGELPWWHFPLYSLLTQAGVAMLGLALLRSALPRWLGWLLIGSMGLVCMLFLITKDMPPLVYYLCTFLTGGMLYRTKAQPVWQASPSVGE